MISLKALRQMQEYLGRQVEQELMVNLSRPRDTSHFSFSSYSYEQMVSSGIVRSFQEQIAEISKLAAGMAMRSAAPPIKIVTNEKLTVCGSIEKRWRRLNRPDKVRVRTWTRPDPNMYWIGDLFCAHPATADRLLKQLKADQRINGLTNQRVNQ